MSIAFPSPPARISSVSEQARAAILAASNDEWIEKARRFCSLHGRHLRRRSRERFGAEADAHLQWMAALLLLVPDECKIPCDPARLSAALHAIDAQKNPPADQITRATEQIVALQAWHRAGNRQSDYLSQGPAFSYVPGLWRVEAQRPFPILVLSPNPYSLYTLAVMQLCLHHGIPIAGLLLRSFTTGRFLYEYRRDGPRLFRKIWRKLFLRGDENSDSSPLSLSKLLNDIGNAHGDVRRLARDNRIPVLSSADWNAEPVLSWVDDRSPQMGLFTGGGMTKSGLQSCFPSGILNVHMGHLPRFKGMDVVENPILEGRRGNVGATAHIMDEGLDTGPIIQRLNFNPNSCRSLGSLRNQIVGLMPFVAIDSALGLCSGRLTPQPQDKCGRQYYFIHPKLRPVLEAAMKSHSLEDQASNIDLYVQMVSELRD